MSTANAARTAATGNNECGGDADVGEGELSTLGVESKIGTDWTCNFVCNSLTIGINLACCRKKAMNNPTGTARTAPTSKAVIMGAP
jgi:hypothetical protein